MYFYLYDSFLHHPKYAKELDRLETRVMDIGIGGKISKLSPLKNAKELVLDAVKKGAHTIVAVGNDATVVSVFDTIAKSGVALGYIPIKGDGKFICAEMLGMPYGEACCETISKRMTDEFDIGLINNNAFLFYAEAETNRVIIQSDKGYKIIPLEKKSRVLICNFDYPPDLNLQKKDGVTPIDGALHAIVAPSRGQYNLLSKIFSWKTPPTNTRQYNTIIPFSEITIVSNMPDEGEEVAIKLDECRVIKTPARISLAPYKLKMIVGKHRRI